MALSIEEELRRAGQARQEFEAPIFSEARKSIYDWLRAERINAKVTDTALHTHLVMMEQVADRFFGYFEQIAQTGKFAADYLEQQQKQERSLRERLLMFAKGGRGSL